MLRFILLLSLGLLTACSTPKVAKIKYQEIYDFNQVKSYSLYPRDHGFNDWQPINDALRNDIVLAIEKSLDGQGYQYANSGESDIVITYFLVGNSAKSYKRYNNGVNYCSYCLVYGSSGSRADSLNVTAGSIILDAVDVKTKRSIWRSSYPLKIKVKDNSQKVQAKIHEVIAAMLNKLPKDKMPKVRS